MPAFDITLAQSRLATLAELRARLAGLDETIETTCDHETASQAGKLRDRLRADLLADMAFELAESLEDAVGQATDGIEVMPEVTVLAHPSKVHRGINVEIDAPDGTPVTVHLNDARVVREVVADENGQPFDQALTRIGIPDDAMVFQIEEGGHGTADWRESPAGMPTEAKPGKNFTRVSEADDWALGQLHTGIADEVWAVATTGGEFRLWTWMY